MATNAVIVTHERLDLYAKKRISIPYVAKDFSVKHIKLFELLRNCQVSFILDS